jgi:RNA polymerase sigma factor (sigma-70 family)
LAPQVLRIFRPVSYWRAFSQGNGAFSDLSALPSETGNHATFLQGKGSCPGTLSVRPNRESSRPEVASLDKTLYGFMNAMPDEPEIDFEKLKADDEGEWERAYPVLYQAGLKVACGYRAQMGEADEDDFIIQAVAKAFAQTTKKASFRHLCNFVATATKNAIRDELKRRASVRHGGGKVESLDAREFGIVDEKIRPGSGDEEPERDQPSDQEAGISGPEENFGFRKRIRPDAALNQRQLSDLLQNALMRIDKRYAQVVWDIHVEKLGHAEIAEKHGYALGSIGSFEEKGLEAMLKHLPEREKVLDDIYKPRKRHEQKKANRAIG